jgi:long-chain acyl-CoA synthetase
MGLGMLMLELATLLTRQSLHHGNREAIVCCDRRYAYHEFAQRVFRAGNLLRSLGVGKGDRVATVMPNGIEQLEIYWAAPSIGAVLVPLSPLLQLAGLCSLLKNAQPSCIVTTGALLPMVEEAIQRGGGRKSPRVLVVGAEDNAFEYERILATVEAQFVPEECSPDDLFNVMYTSGTTGLPKGIMHTHGIRSMYGLLFGQALGIGADSVVVHSGSIVFNGAFVMMLSVLYGGGKYVLASQFDAEQMIELIATERATHITLVPSQIIALLNAPGFDARRLESLRYIMSVGAPLLRTHKDQLNRLLPGRLCEIYGLTEGFVTYLDRRDAQRKADTVGVPIGFSRMRIVREDDSECSRGEIGEIVGQSPLLMAGYYRQEDLTAQAIRDGWLYTGDMGFVDDEGFLHLVDRKKEMIDSGGMKIYPKDVEDVASTHPAVREVAVFGVPHEKWGETPIAAVLLNEPTATTAAELRDWINERVAARYQRVSEVIVMQDFPRSLAGKTLKRELREPYWRATGRNI